MTETTRENKSPVGAKTAEIHAPVTLGTPILKTAATVIDACTARRASLATAESCTGGLIAAALTAIPGAGNVMACGYVTYSNDAKNCMLGVSERIIEEYGAVSADTVAAMAVGALAHAGADISVAVTGIAGPTGGTAEKPVGLVHFAVAHRLGGELVPLITLDRKIFSGDRNAIRSQTTHHALNMLEAVLSS